jgi:hypothetical protein
MKFLPSEERNVQDTALTGFLALQSLSQEIVCMAGYKATPTSFFKNAVFMGQY